MNAIQKVLMGMFARQQQLCTKHDVPPTRVGVELIRMVAKALFMAGVPAEVITTQVAAGLMEGQTAVEKIVAQPPPPLAN